jgi:DDE superfamily endonuclease
MSAPLRITFTEDEDRTLSEHFGVVAGGGKLRVSLSSRGVQWAELHLWIAAKASETLAQTGRITVVVQDNGSLHTSESVRQQWPHWQEQGLYLIFLPPDCSEMNLIESQWKQLKTQEIAGRLFDPTFRRLPPYIGEFFCTTLRIVE